MSSVIIVCLLLCFSSYAIAKTQPARSHSYGKQKNYERKNRLLSSEQMFRDNWIEKEVKRIVSEHFGVNKSKLTHDTLFAQDLGADSLDIVELVMAFEDEFYICINNKDMDKFHEEIYTVGDVIEYAKSRKEIY